TKSTVEVYYNHERIALHQRNPAKGHYNTNKYHLSSTHKNYTDWSPEHFKNKASPHRLYVAKCVEQILSDTDYPEIGYKRVMGLIQLNKSFGSKRLNTACEKALRADMASYRRIKNILENNMEKLSLFYKDLEQSTSHIPKHHNTRGASNYQ